MCWACDEEAFYRAYQEHLAKKEAEAAAAAASPKPGAGADAPAPVEAAGAVKPAASQ
jgi:hypothetical protein